MPKFLIYQNWVNEVFKRPTASPLAKPRINFVDLAKGVCILLVVWGHALIVEPFSPHILFHLRMPLYFVLSGIFFKDYGSFIVLLEKKINKLLVPFIFWGILGVSIDSFLWGGMQVSILDILYKCPKGNPPVWFLLSLFWCNIVFSLIVRNVKSEIWRLVAVLMCGIMGIFMIISQFEPLPKFTQAFLAMPFFIFGYYLRRSPLMRESEQPRCKFIVVGSGLLFIGVVIFNLSDGALPGWIDFVYDGSWIIFYLLPIFLVIGLIMICKGIGGWLPIVSYFGRYSIIVLVIHWFFVSYVYFPFYCFGIEISPFILFVLTFFLSWLSIPVLKAWVPGLVAQKEWVRLPRIENLRKMVRVAK